MLHINNKVNMHTERMKVTSLMPIKQYEAITIPEDIRPGASLEHRTLILQIEMIVVFFNDGMLSFIRPN